MPRQHALAPLSLAASQEVAPSPSSQPFAMMPPRPQVGSPRAARPAGPRPAAPRSAKKAQISVEDRGVMVVR